MSAVYDASSHRPVRPHRGNEEARRGRDLRRRNAAAMLHVLRERGPLPRVDLAAALDLGSGSVTRIAAELAEYGLLQELAPLASPDVGRRRVPVDLRADRFLAAGVHIGLQYTTYGLVNLRGTVVDGPHRITHANTDPAAVADEVVGAVTALGAAAPGDTQVIGAGLSSGGFVDPLSGTVADHDALGWHDVDVAGMIGGRLDWALTVDSTYRAMAAAEMWFGAARDARNFVHIFIGHVIGAAIVVDGSQYDGTGLRAGRIAHLPTSHPSVVPCSCGRDGCLTSVAGIPATIEKVRRAGRDVASAADVVSLARDGDLEVTRVMRERAEAIGAAVAVLVDILAPQKIVLAGAVLPLHDELSTIRAAVAAGVTCPVTPESIVVMTALGGQFIANVVASATPALKLFYDDPLAFVSRAPAGAGRLR